ncbi:MAG TPA: aminopeptidase P family protein [Pseudogracilibacillus sp.]|nr:aminopeptidase P family protein [Pseudogracilibacillus sp.]
MSVIRHVREKIREKELDALLITNEYNRYYVTQFTGSSGVALITLTDAFFITDFRYTEQAKEEASAFTIIEYKDTIEAEIEEIVQQSALKRLGFESEDVSFAQYEQYRQNISAQLVATSRLIDSIRMIKRADEIAKIEKAATIADEAFDHILSYIKPGVIEKDIALELEYFMRKRGASAASFDIIVASGYRSALPHGIASDKAIEAGELVTLDFGAVFERYCSDITRTVAVGNISDELKTIYDVVLKAQEKGVANIKPNMSGKEADLTTRSYIQDHGYGQYFGHSTGHGIGLEVHEGPGLSPRSELLLRENMVVTVEPGIYIPQVGGCRIEDDIVLKEDGNIRLTNSTKQFIQL